MKKLEKVGKGKFVCVGELVIAGNVNCKGTLLTDNVGRSVFDYAKDEEKAQWSVRERLKLKALHDKSISNRILVVSRDQLVPCFGGTVSQLIASLGSFICLEFLSCLLV